MFGFGASHASSNSQSTSLDESLNTSSSFSNSLSQAASQGQSTSGQTVYNADYLKKLYSGALDAADTVNPSIFQGQAADLYNNGSSILDTLGVGAGEDYLSSRLTDTSARDAQLSALGSGLGDLFTNSINPAIGSHAVGIGKVGSAREGVAQGVAAGQIAKQYQQGAASIISSDQSAKDAAAAGLISGQNNAAQIGLGAIPGLASVAQTGSNAPLSTYSALASILGGPTVLTNSQSTEASNSQSIAQAISEALGLSYGSSQSTSNSKNSSFNVSGGP